MGEIEAEAIRSYIGTRLLHVIAQHLTQSGMEDMGSGMVALDGAASMSIHTSHHLIPRVHATTFHAHPMSIEPCFGRDRIRHVGMDGAIIYLPGVTHLTAHLGVEGSAVKDDLALLTVFQGRYLLTVLDEGNHLRRADGVVVAEEFRGAYFVQHI